MWSLPNAVSVISCNKIKFDNFFKMKIQRGLLNSFIVGARDHWTNYVLANLLKDLFGPWACRSVIPSWSKCLGEFKGTESKLSRFGYCWNMWSRLRSSPSSMFNIMWKSRLKLYFKMYQRLCRLCWCVSVLHWLSQWMSVPVIIWLLSGIRDEVS